MSLRTTSSHFVLGFPTGPVLLHFPLRTYLVMGLWNYMGNNVAFIIIRRPVDGPNTNHRRKLSLFEDSSLLSRYTVSKQSSYDVLERT